MGDLLRCWDDDQVLLQGQSSISPSVSRAPSRLCIRVRSDLRLLVCSYSQVNRPTLCKNIIRAIGSSSNPQPFDAYPIGHRVTWRYYMGMLSFLEEDYPKVRSYHLLISPLLLNTTLSCDHRQKTTSCGRSLTATTKPPGTSSRSSTTSSLSVSSAVNYLHVTCLRCSLNSPSCTALSSLRSGRPT